jgi:membrane-associated phospholipid phosphatase
MCFGAGDLNFLWPHIAIRLMLITVVVCLALLTKNFPNAFLRFLKNLYPLIFLSYLYTETFIMKHVIFHNEIDPLLFTLEQRLWGCQPSLTFSELLPQAWFREVMNMFYFSYYLLTGLVCVAFYLKDPKHSPKQIFTVIFSFYLFYVIFDLVPTVGPQYYIPGAGTETIPVKFFGRLMHSIVNNFEQPTGAFPSSHVGIAVISALLTYRHYKKLFYFTLPFVVGICFATVYLREHYLVDVVAGILIAPLLVFLTGKAYNKLYGPRLLSS